MIRLNICVTGATGFIGRRLVDVLSRQGHDVSVLSRRSDCRVPDGVRVVRGDLTSSDCRLSSFLARCDLVFHCAGDLRDVRGMRALHVKGTQRLLSAVLEEIEHRGQKIHFVQLSSVGAYGPHQAGSSVDRIVTEDTVTWPVGEYEVTKTQADELVVAACRGDLFTYSILRPSNVIGPEMPNQSLRGLISMVRRGLFFYIGKPGAVATYVHVDDVVAALIKCGIDPRARGQIYNLSSDCLLQDLVNYIADSVSVSSPPIRIPEAFIRTVVRLFDGWVNMPLTSSRIDALVCKTRYPADKIMSDLGFRFVKPLPNAIDELIKEVT
jgi:nucleoside-diphosphate-sugar epimerase